MKLKLLEFFQKPNPQTLEHINLVSMTAGLRALDDPKAEFPMLFEKQPQYLCAEQLHPRPLPSLPLCCRPRGGCAALSGQGCLWPSRPGGVTASEGINEGQCGFCL